MENTRIYKSKKFRRLPIPERYEFILSLQEKRDFRKGMDEATRDSLIKKVARMVIANHKEGRDIAFIKEISRLTGEEVRIFIEHYQEGIRESRDKRIVEIVIHNHQKGRDSETIAPFVMVSIEEVNQIIQDYQDVHY
jgi:GGDEF domain-containing protein